MKQTQTLIFTGYTPSKFIAGLIKSKLRFSVKYKNNKTIITKEVRGTYK